MASAEKSLVFKNTNKELDHVLSRVLTHVLGITHGVISRHKDIWVLADVAAHGQYNLPKSVQAYIRMKLELDGRAEVGRTSERGKQIHQAARKLQLQNDVSEGILVKRSDASAVVSELANGIRSGLAALPGRLANVLAGTSSPGECKALLDAEIEELLRAINVIVSKNFVEPGAKRAGQGGGADTKADAKPNARPVGRRKSNTPPRKRRARKVAK